jgi:2'-5' RNA ligase
VRAFVAVDCKSAEISKLQQDMLSSSGWSTREVNPVASENFHFTLIFLGEVTDVQTVRVKEKLAEVKFEPFSVTYTGTGAFPNNNNARVVWVGVDIEGAKKLQALARQVIEKMAGIGFRPDKPFSPHLTIFRAKNRHMRLDAARYANRTFGADTIDKLHLKKSDLSPSGPTYSNIYTVSAIEGQA